MYFHNKEGTYLDLYFINKTLGFCAEQMTEYFTLDQQYPNDDLHAKSDPLLVLFKDLMDIIL